jgi:regulator-associated protein of mTOR
MVRLYRNYDPVYEDGKLELVSAWRALSVMTKVTRRAGLISDWNQNLARLLVGGDSDNINCWDAVRECVAFVSLTARKNFSSPHPFTGSQY